MAYKEKQVGRRDNDTTSMPPEMRIREADMWLRTVQELRGTNKVCKRGLFKFRTFEEADQWMEMMIVASTQESQR